MNLVVCAGHEWAISGLLERIHTGLVLVYVHSHPRDLHLISSSGRITSIVAFSQRVHPTWGVAGRIFCSTNSHRAILFFFSG